MGSTTLLTAFVGLALLCLLALVPACEAIAGIEDRYLVDGGTGGSNGNPSSPMCQAYCSSVIERCGEGFAQYASEEQCLAVCAHLTPGDPDAPTGNTVACRANQARLAGSTREPAVHCPRAGPGGGDICGSNCESYCALMESVCSEDSVDDCERKCSALRDDGSYDVVTHYNGDVLQCRLVHLSSATLDPDSHCWHSLVAPDPDGPCVEPASRPPSCSDYCRLVMAACTDDFAVYESIAQCETACGALAPGGGADRVEDTVGCRVYHAYSSLEAPDPHCPHASPSGDGHCGVENCAPYCRLLEAACPDAFDAEFGSASECETACASVPGAPADSNYSVSSSQSGDSVQCRILHATRAFAEPSACESALGRGSCQ